MLAERYKLNLFSKLSAEIISIVDAGKYSYFHGYLRLLISQPLIHLF